MTRRYADGRLAQVGDNRIRYDAGGRGHVVEGSAKGQVLQVEALRAFESVERKTEEHGND